MSILFDLERTNQLSLLPDKDLVDLCLPIEPYQVTKSLKYLGLLKMLYIADRLALKTMDQPITGDRYVSMDYGPVLSGVYDLIKGQPVDSALPLWSKYISPQDSNYVDLLQYPGNEEL